MKNRYLRWCLGGSLLLLTVLTTFLPAAAQTNLLANAGFEEGFHVQGGAAEVTVANGWTAWWVQGTQGQINKGYLVRPEFQSEDANVQGGLRVHGGQNAQKFFNTFSTHDAGLLQTVTVPAGANLQFTAWVQTWSTGGDDPEGVIEPGNYNVSIGIDPVGGANPTSASVLWSQPVYANSGWIQLSVVAQAEGDTVTVFTRGAPQFRVKHNDSYWDDLSLMDVGDNPLPVAGPVESQPVDADGPLYHTVQAGENLFRISLRYNTTMETLMALNGITNPHYIYLGQQILLRGTPAPAAVAAPAPAPLPTSNYVVQPGDSLGYIAVRYNTTVQALSALNNLVNPELIYAGQTLVVTGYASPPPAPAPQIRIHYVQPGEMLSTIASYYGVNMWALADANGLNNVNFIWVGQRLIIPPY